MALELRLVAFGLAFKDSLELLDKNTWELNDIEGRMKRYLFLKRTKG